VCLAVWLSGNALASINVVALRQVRLVPGWVTACGRVNHLCICNQPKANSAFHPYGVDKSSTNLPLLGWRRDGHLCRVAGNTVWSHWQVASRSSKNSFTFTFYFGGQIKPQWNSLWAVWDVVPRQMHWYFKWNVQFFFKSCRMSDGRADSGTQPNGGVVWFCVDNMGSAAKIIKNISAVKRK